MARLRGAYDRLFNILVFLSTLEDWDSEGPNAAGVCACVSDMYMHNFVFVYAFVLLLVLCFFYLYMYMCVYLCINMYL